MKTEFLIDDDAGEELEIVLRGRPIDLAVVLFRGLDEAHARTVVAQLSAFVMGRTVVPVPPAGN